MVPFKLWRAALLFLSLLTILMVIDGTLEVVFGYGQVRHFTFAMASALIVLFLARRWGRVLVLAGAGDMGDQELREKVLANMPPPQGMRKVEFSVVDSEKILLMTACEPAGARIFISSRVVRDFPSTVLAGAIAHEFGHLRNNHPRKLAAVFALIAAVNWSVGIPLPGMLAVLMAFVYVMRRWEFVADKAAADIIGADAVANALRQFGVIAEEKPTPPWLEIFSAYPSLDKRIEAVAAMASPGGSL